MRVEEIQILVADVVLPPPEITVSEWSDQNRRLSSESAAERGEWRTDRAPYQRAIMDALSPNHPCEQVVLMSGAQLGKTCILENFSVTSSTSIPVPFCWSSPARRTPRPSRKTGLRQ